MQSNGTEDALMREELRAVLHASRELPSQLDDTVIDAFIDRLDRHIDQRVAAVAQMQPRPPGERHRPDAGGVAAIVGVGIPFVVLAGVFGHTPGALLAIIVIGVLGVGQMIREHLD
jgi:hypothetical protein